VVAEGPHQDNPEHAEAGDDVGGVKAGNEEESAAVGRRVSVQSFVEEVEPLVDLAGDENRAEQDGDGSTDFELGTIAGLYAGHAAFHAHGLGWGRVALDDGAGVRGHGYCDPAVTALTLLSTVRPWAFFC